MGIFGFLKIPGFFFEVCKLWFVTVVRGWF
jgi:hypothetical protein